MNARRRFIALVIALAGFRCATHLRAEDERPWTARVESVVGAKGFRDGQWGLLVVDQSSGAVVFERNPDEMFCPASVTKLFTCASALNDFGANYRFITPVVRTGAIAKSGKLDGNLILVASGDLCLGGRTGADGRLLFTDHDHIYADGNYESTLVAADPLAGLDHLARETAASGIKEVGGDVLIDDRLFPTSNSTGSGPSRVTPIMVNDNLVDLVITPGEKVGEPAAIKLVPSTSFVTMDPQIETVAEGKTPSVEIRAEGSRRFSVRGKIPLGHKPIVKYYEIEEPASFARALFIEALRKRGVRVSAAPIGGNDAMKLPSKAETAKLSKVAEYTSPPFKEYIRVILKVSHNLHASTLPLLVASKHGESTLEQGLKREGAFLKSVGVDIDSISFGGGAGGSRADLVTPRAAVALLRAMAKRADFASYADALPVLGHDGTLSKSVPSDSPARGHVRAKTGTYYVDDALNGKGVLTSKALAGYIETASGKTLVFAFFLNNVPLGSPEGDGRGSPAEAGRALGKLAEIFYLEKDDVPKADAAATGR